MFLYNAPLSQGIFGQKGALYTLQYSRCEIAASSEPPPRRVPLLGRLLLDLEVPVVEVDRRDKGVPGVDDARDAAGEDCKEGL